MKIIVVGGSGTIGRAVVAALKGRNDVVSASRSGDHAVDITDSASIRKLFDAVGEIDAVVSCAGTAHFGDFADLTEREVAIGLNDKLMGQVNLMLIGRDYVRDGGSFTMTSGLLSHDPIPTGACASMVNGALESFARAAAIELPRGLRINVVSPGLLEESAPAMGHYFPGQDTVSSARVANAYVKSVEGRLTGQVIRAE